MKKFLQLTMMAVFCIALIGCGPSNKTSKPDTIDPPPEDPPQAGTMDAEPPK